MTASRRMGRELISTFLVIQGAGCLLWWLALWQIPATRAFFTFSGLPQSVLFAFALPDIVLYGIVALLGAEAVARRWRCATALVGMHTGAAVYAELQVLSLAMETGGGWNGVALMAPGAILLPFALWHLVKEGSHAR